MDRMNADERDDGRGVGEDGSWKRRSGTTEGTDNTELKRGIVVG
jgi:hypothetical protein